MAFWKKSGDPWDIDPEKRRKKSEAVWWEQEAPAPSGAETQGSPSGPKEDDNPENTRKDFLQKKEREQVSSEKCPWCGKDMEWGCITGGRDSVSWKNWKPKGLGLMRPEGWKEIDLLDEGERAPYKTVWFCNSCGKMVLDVPKSAGLNYIREGGKVK